MSSKQSIGVIFGGRSGEHAVSLQSAKFVLRQFDPKKYAVTQIGITRDGDWWTGENVLDALLAEDTSGLRSAFIFPTPVRPGLYTLEDQAVISLFAEMDVIFPVLHGAFGEDGALQGLLELTDIAYVGPGVTGAAVGMDKAIFYDVMRANQIPMVDTVLILRSEMESDIEEAVSRVEDRLGGVYPMFVKPANSGSSVGVSKVRTRSDLLEGLSDAAHYDRRVIVQKGLDIREIEVSVMGNHDPRVSLCGEVLPGEEFYSYEAKYHDESSKTVIPADIPEAIAEKVRALAIKAYKASDIAGLARVDFFLEKNTGEIYLNELNTIPGFTEISMYPLLWEASGVSNQELVEHLINYAIERKQERDATSHIFRRVS